MEVIWVSNGLENMPEGVINLHLIAAVNHGKVNPWVNLAVKTSL
jgi:hypothetical protein